MAETIVAQCGLVCTNCGMYIKGKCLGCFGGKPMNSNCHVKRCNQENEHTSCADCCQFNNLKQCGKLNNVVSKFFGFVFGTNRIGNLNRIREVGYEQFKEERARTGKK